MKNRIYSKQTKLADIVSSNPIIISVLERLAIKFGFGEATIGQICSKYDFSPELLIEICNIYTIDGYKPTIEKISLEDITKLLDYLLSSHNYYNKKSLPALHKKIHKLLEKGSLDNKKILNKFYDDYNAELTHHFEYEEKEVFPYVRNLIEKKKGREKNKITISDFEKNHTNIEEKLADLKSIVLKYLPESYPQQIIKDVLLDIFNIEADLIKHTKVEDLLLVPLVLKLERQK